MKYIKATIVTLALLIGVMLAPLLASANSLAFYGTDSATGEQRYTYQNPAGGGWLHISRAEIEAAGGNYFDPSSVSQVLGVHLVGAFAGGCDELDDMAQTCSREGPDKGF